MLCTVLSLHMPRYRKSSCKNSILRHGNDSLSKFNSVQFLLSLICPLQSCTCTWMWLTAEVPLLYSNLIIVPVALLELHPWLDPDCVWACLELHLLHVASCWFLSVTWMLVLTTIATLYHSHFLLHLCPWWQLKSIRIGQQASGTTLSWSAASIWAFLLMKFKKSKYWGSCPCRTECFKWCR